MCLLVRHASTEMEPNILLSPGGGATPLSVCVYSQAVSLVRGGRDAGGSAAPCLIACSRHHSYLADITGPRALLLARRRQQHHGEGLGVRRLHHQLEVQLAEHGAAALSWSHNVDNNIRLREGTAWRHTIVNEEPRHTQAYSHIHTHTCTHTHACAHTHT